MIREEEKKNETVGNGFNALLTKYCHDSKNGYEGYSDNYLILKKEDDAASVNWGEDWKIPTREQWDELKNMCKWTWTGRGYKVEGPNLKSIFLPATGCKCEKEITNNISIGFYYSSALSNEAGEDSWKAWALRFERGKGCDIIPIERYIGLSVRPVRVAKEKLGQ